MVFMCEKSNGVPQMIAMVGAILIILVLCIHCEHSSTRLFNVVSPRKCGVYTSAGVREVLICMVYSGTDGLVTIAYNSIIEV